MPAGCIRRNPVTCDIGNGVAAVQDAASGAGQANVAGGGDAVEAGQLV